MTDNPVFAKYPEAKYAEGATEGYSYEFPDFFITKNITGMGGWIVQIKADKHNIDVHSIDHGVQQAREYMRNL